MAKQENNKNHKQKSNKTKKFSMICKKRGMMRSVLVLFSVFVLLVVIPDVDARLFQIDHVCERDICVEGQEMRWLFTFTHNGSRPVEYTKIELIDSINHTVIAFEEREYFPLSSYRGDLIVVDPLKKTKLNFTSIIPQRNFDSSVLYYPCFTNTIDDIHVFVRNNDYVIRQCYRDFNLSIPIYECLGDVHCPHDEYCSENECVKLECKECQYISNHQCVSNECCSNDHCSLTEVCEDNFCVPVQCGVNQMVQNRTCKQITCSFDEQLLNNSCKPLQCNPDEYVFNHTCKPLQCSSNQYILNHTCKECLAHEYLEDGTCKLLNCLPTEGYEDHSCVPLQCKFYQDIVNHKCRNNNSIFVKLGLEAIAIIAIIVLLVLDLRKAHRKEVEETIFINKEQGKEKK